MKKTCTFTLELLLACVLVTSCISSTFYQVYTTEAIGNKGNTQNVVAFEDDNCVVTYDLWTSRGMMSFNFYKKTNKNLYINLSETFFVLNGTAYDYYNDETYSTSTTNAQAVAYPIFFPYSTTIAASQKIIANRSVIKSEKKIICIPPQTTKNISSIYAISNSVYRDCHLIFDPNNANKQKIYSNGKTVELKGAIYEEFNKENSPLSAKNIIAYSFFADETRNFQIIETPFYVSKIQNYTEKDITAKKDKEAICGEKQYGTEQYFTIKTNANTFYIKYSKSASNGTIKTYAGH